MALSMLFAASWTVQAAPEGAADPATAPAAETAAMGATPAPSAKPEDLIGKKVAFVEVAGAVNIKPETILAVTRLKPGEEWTPDKVRQDLRMIYEMGTFADVTADFAAIPEGVKVIYNVKENPVLLHFALEMRPNEVVVGVIMGKAKINAFQIHLSHRAYITTRQ